MTNSLLKLKTMFLLIISNKVYTTINIITGKFKLNVMTGYARAH